MNGITHTIGSSAPKGSPFSFISLAWVAPPSHLHGECPIPLEQMRNRGRTYDRIEALSLANRRILLLPRGPWAASRSSTMGTKTLDTKAVDLI